MEENRDIFMLRVQYSFGDLKTVVMGATSPRRELYDTLFWLM